MIIMSGAPGHLVPAAVVVDSRNLRGQAGDVLGHPAHASVPGVERALQRYGFSLVEAYFGIATTGAGAKQSEELRRKISFNQDRAVHIEKDERGHILAGRLVERDGVTEEKLVDVLCALQIARLATAIREGRQSARAVVVISEDIDISPAYDLAEELGVPTYAAANQTVHTRRHRWIVLGDDALLDMCGRPGQRTGHEIRGDFVELVLGTAPVTMRARYVDGARRVVVFDHSSGAQGVVPVSAMSRSFVRGAVFNLYAHGVDLGRNRNEFPRLHLGISRPAASPTDLVRTTVVRISGPTTVSVRMPTGGVRSVGAPLGRLRPGGEVLLQVDAAGSPRYVGPVDGSAAGPPAGSDPAPQVVRITGVRRSGRFWPAQASRTHSDVLLSLPEHEAPTVADRYAAVQIDQAINRGSTLPILMACTSKLP
jgi:hypothetical protein